jgi:hypothetical protein
MATKLPKGAFLALASVAWADGEMRPAEGAALLRAAKECGVEGEDLTAIEGATKKKVDFADVDPGDLTPWQKVVTYAIASWLAQLDGVVSTIEHEGLVKLAERIGLDKALCTRAASAAFDIAVLPQGNRPEKYDFAKLEERLRAKLPQVAAP